MQRQAAPPHYIQAAVPHPASGQALPDDRLLLTLDDGRSFVIDAERLTARADGTYHVDLTAAADLAALPPQPAEHGPLQPVRE